METLTPLQDYMNFNELSVPEKKLGHRDFFFNPEYNIQLTVYIFSFKMFSSFKNCNYFWLCKKQ